MRKNTGLRTIANLFWVVGSIFWVMIGSLSGNFIQSLIHIAMGWIILYTILITLDLVKRRDKE